MNLTIITAVIASVLGSGLGYQLQTGRINAIKLELKNEQLDRANERISIQRAARAAIERTTTAVSKAQDVAASRLVTLAADLSSARNAADSLRNASTAAVRDASASLDACASTLATHSQLLGQCAARYIVVAGDADEILNQLILFQEGWPR